MQTRRQGEAGPRLGTEGWGVERGRGMGRRRGLGRGWSWCCLKTSSSPSRNEPLLPKTWSSPLVQVAPRIPGNGPSGAEGMVVPFGPALVTPSIPEQTLMVHQRWHLPLCSLPGQAAVTPWGDGLGLPHIVCPAASQLEKSAGVPPKELTGSSHNTSWGAARELWEFK